MARQKYLLAWALAFAVLVLGGNAHAEIITYSFTANITADYDSTNVIGVNVGETVNGTFSFDTDAPATQTNTFLAQVAYSDTGTIETDAVVIQGGTDGVFLDGTTVANSNYNLDGLSVADSETNTTVTNLSTGSTVSAGFAVQSVTLYFGDANALTSTSLPTSLSLDQFSGATYVVKVKLTNGQLAYAIGDITSLTRVNGSPSAVPELSASGAASSLAVLLGGAYVITTRRRDEAPAS